MAAKGTPPADWLPVFGGSEGLVPELSLGFCATGLDGVPVSRGVFVGSLMRCFVA